MMLCRVLVSMVAAMLLVCGAAAAAPNCAKIVDFHGGSTRTPSGLQYALTAHGAKKAVPGQVAIVQYVLCLPNGKLVDASAPGASFAFTIGAKQVIRGFDEAVRLLGVGDSLRVHIPSLLGYGMKGSPPVIRPNTDLVFQIKLVGTQRVALSTLLKRAFDAHGTDAMQQAYDTAAASGFKGMYAREDDLNSLGYRLLKKHHNEAAIAVLSVNADRFPNSWNSYDSLGDAYRIAGQRDYAIQNYKRALQMNAKDANAAGMLAKLQTHKP